MTEEDIARLVEPCVAAVGLELVEVELRPGIVRVVVDGPAGADLDQLAQATRAVSSVLDEHDPFPGRYTLEVSSPGVERPLRTPEHFRRAVGRDVSVRTLAGTDGERRVQGRLLVADATGVVVDGPGLPDGGRRISYEEVDRARTVFSWGPAPRPTTGGSRRGAPRRPDGEPRPAATGRR